MILSITRAPAIGLAALCLIVTTLLPQTTISEEDRVRLPQNHAYQVVLRDYLATLTVADFEIALEPLSLEPAWVEEDEALHRLWMVARYHQRLDPLPSLAGLLIAADNFVLANVEGEEHILMRAGGRGGLRLRDEPTFSIQPADTVWWALWDYPGNPYHNSAAVRNRAFAVAAVDMIMLDTLHESGTHWVNNARRSDFLGGSLIWLSYVYHAVQDELPLPVREAYETGLAKFMARMTEWGPTGVNDNMDMKSNVAMVYLAAALKDGPVVEQARAYVARNLRLVHGSGMIRDAQGLDASYNGIALVNIVWAAMKSEWPELTGAVRHMSDLKAHLTLPEPDGVNFFGPSHFSTRTGHGSPTDQWSRPYRDMAAAMIADEALYLMFGGRRGYNGLWAAPPRETMLAQVERGIAHINTKLVPSESRFTRWVAGWWPGTINYAHDYYHEGFYARLQALAEAADPLTLPPFSQQGDAVVRAFPEQGSEDVQERDRDTFLIARYADYGAVIYTGPIGRTNYMNFAGGALSAFWTPKGGSLLLGRTGLPVHPENTRQSWADWRLWPTHALSGMTASGDAFSSARIRRRVSEVTYNVGDKEATVTFAGPIGKQHDDSRAAQNGCIAGDVRYQRRFEVTAGGVAIETTLTSDGTDRVTDLCEILPLFLKETRGQGEVPHQVTFRLGDGKEFDATAAFAVEVAPDVDAGATSTPADFVDGVTAVHIKRFDGDALIRFETPQRVRLANEVWTDSYQSRVAVWNLLIDLLGAHDEAVPLPSVTLRYRLEPMAP